MSDEDIAKCGSDDRTQQFQRVLACLNSAFQADPAAIHALLVNRVPCNAALVAHEHVIVEDVPVLSTTPAEHCAVGALGLINGVLSALELPKVAMIFEDRKFLGFSEYVEPQYDSHSWPEIPLGACSVPCKLDGEDGTIVLRNAYMITIELADRRVDADLDELATFKRFCKPDGAQFRYGNLRPQSAEEIANQKRLDDELREQLGGKPKNSPE